MSFHPYFFAIFSRSGAPPTTLLPDGALTYPPAACDSFKRVHDWCKAGWRRSGAPPPPNKNPGYSGGSASRLLSWSFLSHVAVCILNAYSVNTIHTICSVFIEYSEPSLYIFRKQLIAISTYMTCDFAHSMVSMWCNSCILVAFDRWHHEWHNIMYKVSTTWMHFMKLNSVATNFDCDFLETWVLRHLLYSTEPHFLVSGQNCLHFLTQYLDNILDTMDRAVFWTYCLFSRNEPCMYTDCSVLGKPFFNN